MPMLVNGEVVQDEAVEEEFQTTPTILGQLAYQAAHNNVDLSKTIIVFTSVVSQAGAASVW